MLAWRHTHRGWDGVSMSSERSCLRQRTIYERSGSAGERLRFGCGALDVRKACRVIGHLLIMCLCGCEAASRLCAVASDLVVCSCRCEMCHDEVAMGSVAPRALVVTLRLVHSVVFWTTRVIDSGDSVHRGLVSTWSPVRCTSCLHSWRRHIDVHARTARFVRSLAAEPRPLHSRVAVHLHLGVWWSSPPAVCPTHRLCDKSHGSACGPWAKLRQRCRLRVDEIRARCIQACRILRGHDQCSRRATWRWQTGVLLGSCV